jgi:cytochrome c oxidase subunit 3
MQPIVKKKKESYPVAPPRFNLWLIMIASSMFFAAIISAYVVVQPDAQVKGTWTLFNLPVYFFYSVVIVVASSLTIYLAKRAALKDEISRNRGFLAVTLILGLAFCFSQYLGWKAMLDLGLTFVNPRPADISASYVWVITAVHIVHVLGGLILLAVALVRSMQYRIHKKEMVLMEVTHTYWHFVGLLWILLYLFIYFAQ